jgi:hypothetical protein
LGHKHLYVERHCRMTDPFRGVCVSRPATTFCVELGFEQTQGSCGHLMKVNKEPWARTKRPHGPNVQIRCQCQGDKK